MQWWTFLAVLCFAVADGKDKGEWKEVKIKQGPVRGYRDSSGELWTFHNIPYATAPTDKNKFKAPLPPPTWTELFEAVDKHIICPQSKSFLVSESLTMQENCLIANVYVPDIEKKNLSVLVHVHGGAFQVGFGDMVKLKNLIRYKDIIVVNFNYRVGIHGFLCLGTENIPGNAGMKDQVALLRWVQQNIAVFGGNPNDVTIVGYSAGSAAVDLLMISKASEGLFQKVIPESGSSLAAFTVQPDPIKSAKNHASKLGLTNLNDITALEEFYQSLTYETLTADAFLTNTDSTFTFSPCVEDDTGDGAFLTESPFTILKTGDYKKVPLLYGYANMEGLLEISLFEIFKNKMNEKFSDFLPADLEFESEVEKETVANKVKEYFFGGKPVSEDNILGYVDFFSDTLIAQSTLRAVKLHVEAGHDQVYLYEYSYVDEDTPVVPHTNIRGANHCAQTMALADGKNLTYIEEDDLSKGYSNMKKNVREIWHNFVITGKPIAERSSLPAWPAVGVDRSPHMSLGQKVELRGELLPERFRFWQNIYQKYYKEPKPPSRILSKPRP